MRLISSCVCFLGLRLHLQFGDLSVPLHKHLGQGCHLKLELRKPTNGTVLDKISGMSF